MIFMEQLFCISSLRGSKKIAVVEAQREASIERIRTIRKEMDEWISKGVNADDLDRRIYAMEYNTQKLELEAEMEHFTDLSNTIRHLKTKMIREREKRDLDQINEEYSRLDIEQVLARSDYIHAAREVEQEMGQLLDLQGIVESSPAAMTDDSEYLKLVNAQLRS